MGTQISDKEFKDIIHQKFDNKFTIIEYKNMNTNVDVKCNKCNTIKSVNPQKLMYSDNPEWCDKCNDALRISQQIEKIKNEFPQHYNNEITIYLDEVSYLGKNKRKRYWVDFHDNYNYKYQLEYGSLTVGIKEGRNIRRFFQRNPYTCHNIQNYLYLNGINMKLITKDLYTGGAIKPLEFIDKNNNKVLISWNDISNNPVRYKDENYDSFYNYRKIRELTKEEVTKIIYQMQDKLDRPLCQDDFEHPSDDTIGIRIVEKYWKELWLMQKDLGLTITGRHARKVTIEAYLEMILDVCNAVYDNENRKMLVVNDFKKYGVASANAYNDTCKINNTTLRDVLVSYGFELQKAGNGFNHTYNDGERVVSMYEYEFSNFLRDNGLVYNEDYFRDVRYKTLTTTYKGNMNCDYEIHFQGRIFYVELAGVLGNVGHEKCYRENIPIKSKSKEKYRLGLMHKKSIFEKEKLEYYILLPSEMNEETYKQILESKYK